MLRKQSKTSRAAIVRKLDKAVSEYVRNRDKKCVVCGSFERLTNGHLFSRTAYSTRWDIDIMGNCHAQCWSCNYRHEFDPYPYIDWFVKMFGKEALERLHQRYVTPAKFTTRQLEEKLSEIL